MTGLGPRVRRVLVALCLHVLALNAEAQTWMDYLERRAKRNARQRWGDRTRWHRAAQLGDVLVVVTLGITIILGILIYSQVQTALPTPDNSDLENASNNSTETFADTMELAPIIMIVIIATVILTIVQRFRT